MKKTLKRVMAVGIFAAFSFAMVNAVSATVLQTFYSSLSLGSGYSLTGSTRTYVSPGAYKMSIKPNWLGSGSSKVYSELWKVNSTTCSYIGNATYSFSSTGTTVTKTFTKNTAAGDYYYTFTTKINGTSYGAITTASKGVKMMIYTAEL